MVGLNNSTFSTITIAGEAMIKTSDSLILVCLIMDLLIRSETQILTQKDYDK